MFILKEATSDEVGYALGADEFNIILYSLSIVKSGKQVGEVRRSAVGYFSTVEACLQRIEMLEVVSNDFSDLKAMHTNVQATINTCVKSLGGLNSFHKT